MVSSCRAAAAAIRANTSGHESNASRRTPAASGPNAADFSMYLLNTAHVSSVMGDAFGEPKCVRFSFANSMEKIEEGWKRIKVALAKLK